MDAESALFHQLGGRVELRRSVRAGVDAVPAADANVLVDQNDAVLRAFEYCVVLIVGIVDIRLRARSEAPRVLAVIAGACGERQSRKRIDTLFLFDDPAVAHVVREDAPPVL
jgi:hypothetical protein